MFVEGIEVVYLLLFLKKHERQLGTDPLNPAMEHMIISHVRRPSSIRANELGAIR